MILDECTILENVCRMIQGIMLVLATIDGAEETMNMSSF